MDLQGVAHRVNAAAAAAVATGATSFLAVPTGDAAVRRVALPAPPIDGSALRGAPAHNRRPGVASSPPTGVLGPPSPESKLWLVDLTLEVDLPDASPAAPTNP